MDLLERCGPNIFCVPAQALAPHTLLGCLGTQLCMAVAYHCGPPGLWKGRNMSEHKEMPPELRRKLATVELAQTILMQSIQGRPIDLQDGDADKAFVLAKQFDATVTEFLQPPRIIK